MSKPSSIKIDIDDIFGYWKILKIDGRKITCECQSCQKEIKNISIVDKWDLIKEKTKKCKECGYDKKDQKYVEIGDIFKNWKVVSYDKKDIKFTYCICLVCNKSVTRINKWDLLNGNSSDSCGCSKIKYEKPKVGETYNYWKVLRVKGQNITCECQSCKEKNKTIQNIRKYDLVNENSKKCRECCDKEKRDNTIINIGDIFGY